MWNVCAVDQEDLRFRRPEQLGTHRVSSGDQFGKVCVGTTTSNRWEALAVDEDEDDDEEEVGDGESGRAVILQASSGKRLAAATAAEDLVVTGNPTAWTE